MERLIDALLSAMDENTYMVEHEKQKVKEANKSLKQITKVNEVVEIRIDVEPYEQELDKHLEQLSEYKQEQKKLNKIFKILTKEENNEE